MNNTSHLKIYPNPASKTIYINNTGEEMTISILTISGKMIEVIQVQSGVQQHDVSSFCTGLYLIKYTSNNNSFVEKLVIE